ncbi:C40 family peptidase [Modestobacter sp. SSW1-42]|uniref:C40 family peptidase n=1 Tax=Modestobacter sp. SSW1-42 TaxID=596372 RepID=UPI003987B379
MATTHPYRFRRAAGARPATALALLTVLTATGVALTPAGASAAPGEAATGEQAAQLAADSGHQLEVLTEEYNDARETLAQQQAAAADAAAARAAADAQLAALQDQIAAVAHTAFTGDGLGPLQAFMTSGSADEFLERVATLDSVAGYHNDVLAQVAESRASAERAGAAAAQATAAAEQQLAAVQGQQEQLQTEIADYKAQYAALTAAEQEQANAAHGGPALQAPAAGSVQAGSDAAQVIIDTAMAQVGDPYVWAAGGPDAFDCSGLTQYAFAAAGISLPHSSKAQAALGRPVSRAELQPGDLVYFFSPVSHIGIYIGGGKMVHARTFGEPVNVGSVDMSGYAGARRILP